MNIDCTGDHFLLCAFAPLREFFLRYGQRLRFCAATLMVLMLVAVAHAQAPAEPGAGTEELALVELRLADRYQRLEQVMLRLAELSASSDPRRATVLRRAVARSKEEDVSVRFESIVKLLEEDRLATASKNQQALQTELRALLDLLLKEDRADRLESEQKRIRRYLKQINRLIRQQKGVKARTEGGDSTDRLAESQKNIGDQTEKLADEIAKSEGPSKTGGKEKESDAQDGKSGKGDKGEGEGQEGNQGEGEGQGEGKGQGEGQGQPGGGEGQQAEQPQQKGTPAQDRLRDAQQRMQQAQEKLRHAERSGATEEQQKALEALAQARAELEEILRQLREEQRERLLTMLEARFRKMLRLQVKIYETTQQLDRIPVDRRDHDEEIEAGRLSRQERLLVGEADKAMRLLEADGTSVAFPEAVEQMREDMQQVAGRLAHVQVGTLTQAVEEDIITALEEMIESLQKAQKEQESRKGQPSQGQPTDPALVDQLAELKMIRLLQIRVNRRTERYSSMLEGSQALSPELLKALDRLAQREQRIVEATRDLETGKNR